MNQPQSLSGRRGHARRTALLSAGLVLSLAVTPAIAVEPSTSTGPSSSQTPYVVPVASGVRTVSILTVGDAVGSSGYRMVGIPDGLGAIPNGNGTYDLLMNHELGTASGVVRAHGQKGAFVSRWTIDATTHEVLLGRDLITTVVTNGSPVIGRLCSADLPPLTAFYNPESKQGYDGQLFMNGEEVGAEGRAFATTLGGVAYDLPALGKFSWENSIAHPDTGNRTVVIGTDDATPGEVYVYVGKKTKKGSAIDRAGLTGGDLYGVVVPGVAAEDRFSGVGDTSVRFTMHNHGDVSTWSGAKLQEADDAAGVTAFLRPEDGAWDPSNPNDFYFVTTDRFDPNKAVQDAKDGRSRLWRLRFDNAKDPAAGGHLDLLLDGTEAQQMLDNLTVDRYGHVYMQEDPGGQAHLAKIWRYDVATDTATVIAQHDPARYTPGLPGFKTIDEESSGIIDASKILGPGWFLFDVQSHNALADPELVQDGQLLALYDPASDPTID